MLEAAQSNETIETELGRYIQIFFLVLSSSSQH